MKKLILSLSVLLMAVTSFAQTIAGATTPPDHATLEKINSLETQVKDLKYANRDLRQEVNFKFQSAESQGNLYLWGIIASYILAIGAGPIAIQIRSKLDRKRLESIAKEKSLELFNKEFPRMAQKQMKEYLDKEVPARVASLINVSQDREQDDFLRETTKSLVLAEDDSIAKERAKVLREKGYLHVSTATAVDPDKLPLHEICLVDHFGSAEEYQKMSKKYLEKVFATYRENPKKGILFLYATRMEGLDFSAVQNKGFANTESTVDSNLMKLIRQINSNQS